MMRDELCLVKGTLLEHFLEFKKDCSDLVADYHLIVVFGDAGTVPASLRKHLRVGGVLLHQLAADARPKSNGKTAHQDSLVEMTLPSNPTLLMDAFRRHHELATETSFRDIVVLLPKAPSKEALAGAAGLKQQPSDDDATLKVLVQTVQDNAASFAGSTVISLLEFSRLDNEGYSAFDWSEPSFKIFDAVQRTASGVVWLTQGAHMKPLSPKGAPIIALARTLMTASSRGSFPPLSPTVFLIRVSDSQFQSRESRLARYTSPSSASPSWGQTMSKST